MEKLNLPVFKGDFPARKPLSMDDYLKFVIFNLRHTFKNKLSKKKRKAHMANVPFAIR